jgi:DNA topoisomerase-1
VTGAPIELREGRYGPYVADGQTNASIPKGVSVDDVTFDMAVSLLAERAARGPAKGRARGKRSSKAPRGKTSRKKTSRKKASRKATGGKAAGKGGSRKKAARGKEPGEGPAEDA